MFRVLTLILCICVFAGISGCGSKKAPSDKPGEKPVEKESMDTITIEDFHDLPVTIFDEMKKNFENSQMTLSSLKRDDKGISVRAVITENLNNEQYIPEALKLLAQNFGSVEKVMVNAGDNREYTLEMSKYNELMKSNPDDINSLIWTVVSANPETAKAEKSEPTA